MCARVDSSLIPLSPLRSRRSTPSRTPNARPSVSDCVAARRAQRVVPQKRRTECADGPVPRLCFLDAIHRQSVRRPCSVCLCAASASLMAARQAVWRESSHWDATRQHRADTDAAAVVRRCRLSSAAACALRFNRACLQERHIQPARRRRVRDSADERHCVCPRPPTPPLLGAQLPPPPGEPTSRVTQQAPKICRRRISRCNAHARTKAPKRSMGIFSRRSHPPISSDHTDLATLACSVSLFPQRGTCAGTAERVGQDQSTFTFGRCVSTAVRCCRFPGHCTVS
jgi:hypothetical protein